MSGPSTAQDEHVQISLCVRYHFVFIVTITLVILITYDML